jgi:hypothetical protein
MNSATIKIDESVFFELIGLKNFDGFIGTMCIEALNGRRFLSFQILGIDPRLPARADFPYSHVIVKHIESSIEAIV